MPPQPVAARAFAGDAAQMPFMLHVYPSAAFADGRTAHLPWLQEMPDPMTTVMWGSWVEINPETAHKLEIHEGDVLTITSPQGTIELPAFLYPGLRPDVIAIPVGQGHTQFGRYAQNVGANPLRISASALDQTSGAVVQTGVRVSATKTGRNERIDQIRRIGCRGLTMSIRCTDRAVLGAGCCGAGFMKNPNREPITRTPEHRTHNMEPEIA